MQITREAIIELENKLIMGIKENNVKLLDSLLHDDLLFIVPNGQTITKERDLASHSAGEMVVEELSPTIENIKIIDDTAVVIVVYDTRGRMLNQPIQGRFRYIRIWKQFRDGIKVIGGSCFQLQ